MKPPIWSWRRYPTWCRDETDFVLLVVALAPVWCFMALAICAVIRLVALVLGGNAA